MRKKMQAMERILALVDRDSFLEFGAGVKSRSGADLAAGVITGSGTVDGRRVVVYAQDASVMAGTLGKKHGEKIARAIRMAMEQRCPLIGIHDSGGARIQEGVNALAGYGEIFRLHTMASGYIPQIAVIAGSCAGGAAYSPGLMDFVFMIQEIGSMYITGPRVVEAVLHQEVSPGEYGSAKMHREKSGTIHFSCEDEESCYRKIRKLLSLIPHCCEEAAGSGAFDPETSGGKGKRPEEILPARKMAVYQMEKMIETLVDGGDFLEVSRWFARNIITGFGRMEGRTVGIVASQPYVMGGVLDVDSSVKAARFIRYCDCYDIPVVTLVDVPGFMPEAGQEERGIIRHGAKLLYAYAESTVPKITVILRRAYGGAYIAMGSRHLGADFVYAWPGAEIAVMGEEGAVEILHHRQLAGLAGAEREERLRTLAEEYREETMNAREALAQGYVDDILAPSGTRDRICRDLKFLRGSGNWHPVKKKHGNIPL